jgi:hypothetical protein
MSGEADGGCIHEIYDAISTSYRLDTLRIAADSYGIPIPFSLGSSRIPMQRMTAKPRGSGVNFYVLDASQCPGRTTLFA